VPKVKWIVIIRIRIVVERVVCAFQPLVVTVTDIQQLVLLL